MLRLSLTARCNLACPYCLPDGQEPEGLLSLEQRLAVVEAAVALGFHSLRLTGGEPLLHPGLTELVAAVQPLRRAGLRQIAVTSNGLLLTASAGAQALARVLAAIDHARAAGFDPARGELKLNAVIQRDRNDDQLVPLARLARHQGVELRLIEAMDVGSRNGWTPQQVVPAAEMVQTIASHWPLLPLGRKAHGTASRWRYRDGGGHLAVVASITAPFCGDCDRLRITANGIAYPCLFASVGTDLRPQLQPAIQPDGLRAAIARLWGERTDRYSEERGSIPTDQRASPAEMAVLGG